MQLERKKCATDFVEPKGNFPISSEPFKDAIKKRILSKNPEMNNFANNFRFVYVDSGHDYFQNIKTLDILEIETEHYVGFDSKEKFSIRKSDN